MFKLRYLLATLVLVGCSSEKPSPKLLDAEKPAVDKAAEDERLRNMQLVRVVDPDTDEIIEMDPVDFAANMTSLCAGTGFCLSGTANACAALTCYAKEFRCIGEVLLGVAEGTGTSVEMGFGLGGGPKRVPPQTSATNATIAGMAAQAFQNSIEFATSALIKRQFQPNETPGTAACTTSNLLGTNQHTDDRTTHATLASVIANSYDMGKRAFRVAYDETLAVSDAELASTPAFGVARTRAISKQGLSRSAAAHLYVGGADGFRGSTTEAFCTSGRLSGPENAALTVMREAALSPADILNEDVKIDALVDGAGGGTQPAFGTVKARLSELLGTFAIPSNQPVASLYGLKLDDFAAARRALADEIDIFARSQHATLQPKVIPSRQTPTFARFAATAGKPPERPEAYWGALSGLRTADPPNTIEGWWHVNTSAPLYPIGMPFGLAFPEANTTMPDVTLKTNLSAFVDNTHNWIAQILRANYLKPETYSGTDADNLQTGLFDPLGFLIAQDDYAGRLEQCWQYQTQFNHTIKAYGYTAADHLILVRGEDLMSCAVDGSIEGAACSLPDLATISNPSLTHGILQLKTNGTAAVGQRDTFASGTLSNFTPDTSRWYLLKPRQAGSTNPGPGQWKALVGVNLYHDPSYQVSDDKCRATPIVPAAIEGAAKAMAPSRDWCGVSEVQCAGAKFDERLPLEDELSGDGDDVESSWRHYLEMARAAAAEADQLGNDYIAEALREDLRDEELDLRRIAREERAVGELQRLQQICGTAVDPKGLLKALGSIDDQFDLHEADKGVFSGGSIPAGYKVIAGRMFASAHAILKAGPADPELTKLYECAASLEDFQETHLGNEGLCVSTTSVTLGCDACAAPAKCLPKESGLAFFDTRTLIPKPLPNVCQAVQMLRANPAATTAGGESLLPLVAGDYFSSDALANAGQSINVELVYGGYVNVKFANATYTTASPAGTWPCAASTNEACDGLFCDTWQCGNAAERGKANLRLYRAALVAKLTTWRPGDPAPEVESPYYLNDFVQPDVARITTNRHTISGHNITELSGGSLGTGGSLWRSYKVPAAAAGTDANIGMVLGSQTWFGIGPAAPVGAPSNRPMNIAFRRGPVSPDTGTLGAHLPISVNDFHDFWDGMGDSFSDPGVVRRLLAGQPFDTMNVKKTQGIQGPPVMPQDIECNSGDCPLSARDLPIRVRNYLRLQFDPSVSQGSSFVPFVDAFAILGNQLYPPPTGTSPMQGVGMLTLDREALLDALELMCLGAIEAGATSIKGGCDLSELPKLSGISDLKVVGHQLECMADEMTRRAATAVFNLPQTSLSNLLNGNSSFEARGGDMNVATSDLRSALQEVAISGPIIGGAVDQFGQDMRALEDQLKRYDIQRDITHLEVEAEIIQQQMHCMETAAKSAGNAYDLGGAQAAAMIACLSSFIQIGFATAQADLRFADLSVARDQALAEFSSRSIEYKTTLETQSLRLAQALEDVQRNLKIIEGLKAEARRVIDSALWSMTAQAANEGEITNVLNNLKAGARIRYKRALASAQHMSFLAKRAIEQRLGIPLGDMVEDLPLVTAPASWESTVCTTTGIDYEKLREAGQAENFANGFIGDYVDKLEQVVESYRLVNNFHEGSDTAVISLRDDILNTRAECEYESRNQLYLASRLDQAAAPVGESVVGWKVDGCVTETFDHGGGQSVTRSKPDCVTIKNRTDAPFFDPDLGQLPVGGFDVVYGGSGGGWQAGAALRQELLLKPGRYRLSWYTEDDEDEGGAVAAVVRKPSGAQITAVSGLGDFLAGTDGDWNRVYDLYDITEEGTYSFGFERPSAMEATISLAAPMVERLSDPTQLASDPEPTPFMDSSETRMSTGAVCQDTTGGTFRREKWERQCVNLCPDGYQSDCGDSVRTECFWQTTFHISQRGIESGKIINQSGFARGNFNYRIDSLALNFVGTSLRDCTDSMLPATCYAAGFIPYSLRHAGPFYVRNHRGTDYEAKLFPGVIEHARGLGTERYLTNPLSDADTSLVTPYLRKELRGRPLDGEFMIRIWDEPGVNFEGIEDIQLLLNYRYWTRFN